MTALVLAAAFLLSVSLPRSAARGDSSYLLTRLAKSQAVARGWHLRYLRMRRYARGQERMRALQLVELRKVRALIPDPYWVPAWFRSQASCIHRHESIDWHERGDHRGGMQFSFATWASVGGRGDPADASPAEQVYRAYLVWKRDGGSWREWTTAGMCGLG